MAEIEQFRAYDSSGPMTYYECLYKISAFGDATNCEAVLATS